MAKEALERKTAELAEQREWFQVTLSSIGDAVITSLDGTLLWMSDAARKILCVGDLRDVIGQPWLEFWQGRDRSAALAAVETARRGGTGNFFGWHAVDGQARCWDVIITPILDPSGRPERLLAVSRDVTEPRKLEEVHSRVAAVVEFSDDAIISETLDGIITTWNTGAARMFGVA